MACYYRPKRGERMIRFDGSEAREVKYVRGIKCAHVVIDGRLLYRLGLQANCLFAADGTDMYTGTTTSNPAVLEVVAVLGRIRA